MSAKSRSVAGVSAPSPRVTPLGALLFTLAVALPVGALLALAEWLL